MSPHGGGLDWVAVSYVASISAQVSFAAYAVWYTRNLTPAPGSTGALHTHREGDASSHREGDASSQRTRSARPDTESIVTTSAGCIGPVSEAQGFVTARGTQGRWRLAWSFFAGSMGAWAVTGPAAYAVHSGKIFL